MNESLPHGTVLDHVPIIKLSLTGLTEGSPGEEASSVLDLTSLSGRRDFLVIRSGGRVVAAGVGVTTAWPVEKEDVHAPAGYNQPDCTLWLTLRQIRTK